jgi:hypothetical protein
MPSVASSIFKIRAVADFISPNPELLSFRKGQPFYALAVDHDRGIYHVSTQFAVPFSRTAVSGMVPESYFEQVDLMAKDPPKEPIKAASVAPVRRDCNLPSTRDFQELVVQPLVFVQVLGSRVIANALTFRIQVTRSQTSHVVYRDITELARFHNHLLSILPVQSLPKFNVTDDENLQLMHQRLELYLNSLIAHPNRPTSRQVIAVIAEFYAPRNRGELDINKQYVDRRDSGLSLESERKTPLSNIADKVFGRRKISGQI